jgi:hypothetical protein
MRLLIAVMLAFTVAAVGSVGCTKKTTDVAKPKDKDGGSTAVEDSFTLAADPGKDIELKPGDTKDVKISVTRGKNFKEDTKIKVTFKEDEHVKASTKKEEIAKGDDSFTVTLTAAKSAPKDHAFEETVTGAGGDKEAKVCINGKIIEK